MRIGYFHQIVIFSSKFLLLMSIIFCVPLSFAEPYYDWEMKDFAIRHPIGGYQGVPARGREVVKDRSKGNCLACHAMPIQEESFHGTFGPDLHQIGSRLSVEQIRLRVVNQASINPATVMPAFYKNPLDVNRIAENYIGKTILTAQEVEDVIAYLATLK